MADRKRFFYLGVMLLAGGTSLGCDDTTSMLLDNVCNQTVSMQTGLSSPGCRLEGDAQVTTGISDDSIAVILGPGGGTLSIRINAIPASGQPTWSLDVLASSTRPEANTLGRTLTWGSCGAACPPDPADAEAPLQEGFQWITIIDSELGSNLALPPDDASVILRGRDMEILDIRTPGFEELVTQL